MRAAPGQSGRPEDATPGDRVAALFDLDRTLIRGSATYPLAVSAFRAGIVPSRDVWRDAVKAICFVLRGSTDEGSQALRERVLGAVAGRHQTELVALADTFIGKLARSLRPTARRLLDLHEQQGHDRIIVSASPIEIVSRLADRLGLEGAVGTRGEVDADGRYTGRLAGAFCYGDGKVTEVRRLAVERGYDLAASFAYSDSFSDLPFLRCVRRPVAVNPDRKLRAYARKNAWPIVDSALPAALPPAPI